MQPARKPQEVEYQEVQLLLMLLLLGSQMRNNVQQGIQQVVGALLPSPLQEGNHGQWPSGCCSKLAGFFLGSLKLAEHVYAFHKLTMRWTGNVQTLMTKHVLQF